MGKRKFLFMQFKFMKFNNRILGVVVGTTFILTPALALASFDTNLSVGARGGGVISLQQFLISRGLLASNLATGYFGNLTRQAVKGFQTSQSVAPVSGFFGPLTRAALAEYQKANGITPAVGYFGPKTMGHVNGR